MQSTPPPSTTQQLLGLGIGAAGLGGAVSSMFGDNMSRILRRPMFRGGQVKRQGYYDGDIVELVMNKLIKKFHK